MNGKLRENNKEIISYTLTKIKEIYPQLKNNMILSQTKC